MTHTSEDIKKLDDPYTELNSSDQLVEHQEELDKLSAKEMKKLASKMMFSCPHSELNNFGHAIKAIKGSTFHPVLYQAYEVTQRMHTLLNPEHPRPHDFLTGQEFNGDLFNEFTKLSLKFIKGNETIIATRLALTTPEEQRSELSKNVRNTFRDSELPSKIGAAFTLRRSIDLLLGDKPEDFFTSKEFNADLLNEFEELSSALLNGNETAVATRLALTTPKEGRSNVSRNIRSLFSDSEMTTRVGAAFTLRRNIDLLLGDKPEDFFTSEEFNIDLCNEFSMMFPPLLEGREQAIGEKLSTLDHSVRHKIARNFETINCQAHDKANPFKLISAAMTPKVEEERTAVVVPQEVKPEPITTSSNNRYSFSSELRARKEKTAAITTTEGLESDDDIEEEPSSCISSLCGFLGK